MADKSITVHDDRAVQITDEQCEQRPDQSDCHQLLVHGISDLGQLVVHEVHERRHRFDTAAAQDGFRERGDQEHSPHRRIVDHELDESVDRSGGDGLGCRLRLHCRRKRRLRALGDKRVDRDNVLIAIGEAFVEVPLGQTGGLADRTHVDGRTVDRTEQCHSDVEQRRLSSGPAFFDAHNFPTSPTLDLQCTRYSILDYRCCRS